MFGARLSTNLRRFGSREEVEAYLDLVGDLHLTGDDPRFHSDDWAAVRPASHHQ